MAQYLRFILPGYLTLYLLFLFVIRSVAVGKTIGKSPVMLPATDNIHGLMGRYFIFWIALLLLYCLLFTFFPSTYTYLLPMNYLDLNVIKITGLCILALSLIWTYIAQANMRGSWRVGIDENQKTRLVTTGVFRFSRNPIYLGMLASVAGLFLTTPNGFTLLLAVLAFVLIQIQVRLEEEFLTKMHGQLYSDYKAKVRRFI